MVEGKGLFRQIGLRLGGWNCGFHTSELLSGGNEDKLGVLNGYMWKLKGLGHYKGAQELPISQCEGGCLRKARISHPWRHC